MARNDPNSVANSQDLMDFYSNLGADGDYHEVFMEAARATSSSDTVRNQSIKYLRQAGFYNCAKDVLERNVAGDFAECGSYRGQSAYVIAAMMVRAGQHRPLHLFDSFEGLSEFLPQDNAELERSKAQTDKMRQRFMSSASAVAQNLKPFPFIEMHVGWIPDRFENVATKSFAFVHIDVDLYQPTLDSLDFFIPRMNAGGWIVVDDYNARRYPGCNTAVNEAVQRHALSTVLPLQVGGCAIQMKSV
ncbi:MAG: hypothetical protein HKN11_19340 [Rhizobiales bacterium]|nr:hypothetical protein [Hyphomicrobiales bacterium]